MRRAESIFCPSCGESLDRNEPGRRYAVWAKLIAVGVLAVPVAPISPLGPEIQLSIAAALLAAGVLIGAVRVLCGEPRDPC